MLPQCASDRGLRVLSVSCSGNSQYTTYNESAETKIIVPSKIMLTCFLPSLSASGLASWPQFATGTQIAHFQRYRTQCAGRAQQELASGSNGTSTSHGNLNVLGIRRWSGSGSGEKRRTGPAFSPDPRLRAQTFENVGSAARHAPDVPQEANQVQN